MAKSGESEGQRVKSVDRAFQIIEFLRRENGADIQTVAERLSVANSTAYRYLMTLESSGYLTKKAGQYHVSLRFLRLGEHSRERNPAFQLAREKVRQLADETDERAQFVTESHGKALFVHRAMGEHAVETDSRTGKVVPLHTIAAGKAILAHLPSDRVEEIIDTHGLEARTENTISGREQLFENLEEIRKRGFSYNRQESTQGLSGVGVPVIQRDNNDVIGALSVVGATHRMKKERLSDALPNLLLAAANELELDIAYL